MIHHQHRCIFVHIPKTAGKSINRFFGVEWQPHKDLARYSRELPPEIFASYQKFAVVRNPWERMLSDYNFQKKKATPEDQRLLSSGKTGGRQDFKQWLEQAFSNPFRFSAGSWGGEVSPGLHRWSPQVDWISIDGRIAVDYVLRMEHLQRDFAEVCRRLDLPVRELPCRNWQFHLHYSEYYDRDTQALVAEYHSRDIAAFGYRFETPANDVRWLLSEKIKPRIKSVLRSLVGAARLGTAARKP